MIANTLRTNLTIQVVTLATSIMTARLLGATGRGELALILLYPQLVANLTLLGIDRAVAVLAGSGELTRPVRTVVKLVLLLSLPAVAAGWMTVRWKITDAHLGNLAVIYLLYVPAMHFFVLIVAMFNGIGDFRRFNAARLGFYLINGVFVAAVWAGMPLALPRLDSLLLLNLAAVFGVLLYCIWLLRGSVSVAQNTASRPQQSELRIVLSLAMMFAVPASIGQFNSFAYQIVIEHWMGARALGLFIVLMTYSRLISPIGSAIGSHVFRLGIVGEQSDISKIFRISFVVYSLAIVPLWALAPVLVPLVFGRDFAFDSGVIAALMLSALFSLLSDTLAEYLNGQRKLVADIIGRLLYLATLAMAAVPLIPALGMLGFALAMMAADLIRCGWLVHQVAKMAGSTLRHFVQITHEDLGALLRASRSLLGKFGAHR